MRFKKIKISAFKGGGTSVFVVNSPCLSFFFSASTVAAYIFIAPTCKATIINLELFALNADFQHFIPKFNEISLLYGYPWKKGLWWKEAQRQGEFTNNLSIFIYMPQTIYTRLCKCIRQTFTLALCKCKKKISLQQDKWKCKKFGCASVKSFTLTLDLCFVSTLTCRTLVQTLLKPKQILYLQCMKPVKAASYEISPEPTNSSSSKL